MVKMISPVDVNLSDSIAVQKPYYKQYFDMNANIDSPTLRSRIQSNSEYAISNDRLIRNFQQHSQEHQQCCCSYSNCTWVHVIDKHWYMKGLKAYHFQHGYIQSSDQHEIPHQDNTTQRTSFCVALHKLSIQSMQSYVKASKTHHIHQVLKFESCPWKIYFEFLVF